MADDVRKTMSADAPTTAKATTAPARVESRADRARRLVYRGRFAAFYFVLAVVAGAGVGALMVLVGRGSPAPAPAWSEWEPTGSPESQVAQIGDRVSDLYRLPSGNALAPVTYAGQVTVPGPNGAVFQVQALAVRPDASGGAEDDVNTILAGSTVMYTLCGLGQNCSIPEGKPSLERAQLLRREVLELALYTFHYIDGVDSVLALLPPRADGNRKTAVFVERSNVGAELGRPLNQVLTAPLTPGVGELQPDEQRVIDRVTRSRVYQFSYIQAQDGSPIMVLEPAGSTS